MNTSDYHGPSGLTRFTTGKVDADLCRRMFNAPVNNGTRCLPSTLLIWHSCACFAAFQSYILQSPRNNSQSYLLEDWALNHNHSFIQSYLLAALDKRSAIKHMHFKSSLMKGKRKEEKKLTQLNAMSVITVTSKTANFNTWNNDLRQHYINRSTILFQKPRIHMTCKLPYARVIWV